MRPHAVLSFLILCILTQSLPAADRLPEKLRFYGRWDLRKADRAITVNGGSYLIARFDARSIKARYDMSRSKAPLPTIAWRIDDDSEWRESQIAASVELEKDLTPGAHTIQLLVRGLDEHQPRWSEPLVASITFLGFDFSTGGKLLDPPTEPKLKLEFLGDSITEGVLVHPKRPGRDTWPWMTDALLAFPSQTALRLGAQWRQVGFGAQGLTRGGSGGVPPAPESFEWFYEGCPRDDWKPNVVIINLGTNDGAAKSDAFKDAYAHYLTLIRTAYPNAQVLVLRPFNGSHADDIRDIVKFMRGSDPSGSPWFHFVDTTGWLERSDFTDGVHPNAAAGAKIAAKLEKVIENVARPRGLRRLFHAR